MLCLAPGKGWTEQSLWVHGLGAGGEQTDVGSGQGERGAFRGSFRLSGYCLGQVSGSSTSCSVSALGSVSGELALPTLTIPLFWQDQYQLCYRAALEYLGSFDHYAT